MNKYQRLFLCGGVSGALFGLALCALFGIADVQCMFSPNGPNWDAELQRCVP